MKILCTGDNHFDEHDPRWGECLRVHGWMVEQVRSLGIDLFLCAGDVYERASTPLERAKVAEWLTSIAAHCPVVVVRGNHDAVRDLELLGMLRAAHPVHVVERTATLSFGDVAVGAVAWPSRSSIAQLAESVGVSADTATESLYANVMRGLSAEMDEAGASFRILLAHAMVDGSMTSVGQPIIGAEMRIGLDVLDLANADVTVLGHIHKPQEWMLGQHRVLYTGSPFATSYGETEEKSVLLIDSSSGEVRRIPTPSTKMVLATGIASRAPSSGVVHIVADDVSPRGADIRLRYSVNAEDAADAKVAAKAMQDRWLSEGAVAVKLEAVVNAVCRARAPEVTSAPTFAEKLEVLWRTRKVEIAPPDKARIFTKLDQLRT
jgi:DNA repair exonuclease SbcCD nuclease subunit